MRFTSDTNTAIYDEVRKVSIPVDPNNRHYREWVESGEIDNVQAYVAPPVDDTPTLEERVAALERGRT